MPLAHRGGTLLLVVLFCVSLFIPPSYGLHHRGHKYLFERGFIQQAAQESAQTAAIPLEPDSYYFNSSASDLSSALLKRDDAQDFHNLACKGDEIIQKVIRQKASSDRIWKQSDLDNGWGSTTFDFLPTVAGIRPALQDLDIPYDTGHARYQWWEQWEKFTIGNDPKQHEPTHGKYRNTYILADIDSMIICHASYSPKHEAKDGQAWPELYRWSDVVWLAWSQIAGDQKSQLRYIVRDDITTPSTRKWMEYIKGAKPNTNFLPWPGQLYDLTSEEGKALLATPHGVGLAYLIADHRYELGGKTYPAVCIWTAPSDQTFSRFSVKYFMMWQLRDAAEGEMEIDSPRTCRDMI